MGVVWALWHYPASLIGTGVPLDMPFGVFVLWVVGGTLLMSWVYNNTGSVLTSILMHITANATFNYLPLLPEWTGQRTSFAVFLGLVALVVLLVVTRYGPKRLFSPCP